MKITKSTILWFEAPDENHDPYIEIRPEGERVVLRVGDKYGFSERNLYIGELDTFIEKISQVRDEVAAENWL